MYFPKKNYRLTDTLLIFKLNNYRILFTFYSKIIAITHCPEIKMQERIMWISFPAANLWRAGKAEEKE